MIRYSMFPQAISVPNIISKRSKAASGNLDKILRVEVLYLCVTYRKRVACCMYMAIKIEQCQRTDLHRVLTKDYLFVFLNLLS